MMADGKITAEALQKLVDALKPHYHYTDPLNAGAFRRMVATDQYPEWRATIPRPGDSNVTWGGYGDGDKVGSWRTPDPPPEPTGPTLAEQIAQAVKERP